MPESVQLSNDFANLPDNGVGEIIIERDGVIISEVTQVKSTQGVGLSNDLGQKSQPNK